MRDNVLEAWKWLRDQFKIDPDPLRLAVARPPFGFHLVDAAGGYRDADHLSPFFDDRAEAGLKLAALLASEDTFPVSGTEGAATGKPRRRRACRGSSMFPFRFEGSVRGRLGRQGCVQTIVQGNQDPDRTHEVKQHISVNAMNDGKCRIDHEPCPD